MFPASGDPAGFGAADYLALTLAVLLALAAIAWGPSLQQRLASVASRAGLCMAILGLLPIVLRLALLPHHPVPSPDIYDEFSHLLVADTLRHFRLANPQHPLSQFFETFFVLQQPTYSSIYPLGQGLLLAFGRLVSGVPWTGVLLAAGAFCSLCYWMLRGWTTPGWALTGGLLAVVQFGPLNAWMNTYYGGTLAATAGCLVFGSLPRLRTFGRRRDAVLLGGGFGIHLLTRPFESLLLLTSVILYLALTLRRSDELKRIARLWLFVLIVPLAAIVLTLLQNRQVTGSWLTLPYQLSQYQYGVPATLTVQSNAIPHRPLTPQQALDYKAQSLTHGGGETLSRFWLRLEYRLRYYRFFFLPPLYIAGAAFLFTLREVRSVFVAGSLIIFSLGTNLFPYLLVHYLAAITCLFVLVSILGLERLSGLTVRGVAAGANGVRLLTFLCVIHFLFWYGVHISENGPAPPEIMKYETWDNINHTNPQRRIAVNAQLTAIPGKLLVFVRYWPQHVFQDEWVWNEADIDASRIVWARDLGATEDRKLISYYPDRKVLLLEPDARPPALSAYKP